MKTLADAMGVARSNLVEQSKPREHKQRPRLCIAGHRMAVMEEVSWEVRLVAPAQEQRRG
jgi:hypothetical protein